MKAAFEHQESADVAIIGGGLAGLTAAAVVAESGKRPVIYERHQTLGGDARSSVHECFTFNQGPHALYRGGAAERIFGELGVAIRGGVPPVKGRIVFGEQSYIAPADPLTLLQTAALGVRDKIEVGKVLGAVPKLRPDQLGAKSVSEWIADLVTREPPRQLLHLIVRLATYGNHPEEMSAEVAATQVQLALGPGVLYLHGGWQTLVDQLTAKLEIPAVRGQPISELPDAPAVIIAGGGPALAAKLLRRNFDAGPAAEVSCLDLGLRRCPEHSVVLGADTPFYFSNHSAVADLAPAKQYCAGVLQYLGPNDTPDAERIRDFARHAGVRDDDIVHQRRLHRMTAVSAVATAEQGGLSGRPNVTDTGADNVFIAGDWVGPEGHLADAAIASGKAAALAAVRRVENLLAT